MPKRKRFMFLRLEEIDAESPKGVPYYQADTFADIPENVTVHLPESFTEEERAKVEAGLKAHGIPESAVFKYYSLRG